MLEKHTQFRHAKKTINKAVVTEQTIEAFDWKLIGFV